CPPEKWDVAAKLAELFALGGSVYINGSFTVNDPPVVVPRVAQIIGAPDAELKLGNADKPLLFFNVKILTQTNQMRLSGIVIRDLKLSTELAPENETTGIAFIGEPDPTPTPAEGPRREWHRIFTSAD